MFSFYIADSNVLLVGGAHHGTQAYAFLFEYAEQRWTPLSDFAVRT